MNTVPRSPARHRHGLVNHLRARVELTCAARGWSFRDLARAMDRTYQGLVSALNRKPVTARCRAKLEADLARALELDMEDLVRPVTVVEYGRAMIPRYEEKGATHE